MAEICVKHTCRTAFVETSSDGMATRHNPLDNPLSHFLNPASVAMVGVSPNPSFASAILNNLVRLNYPGTVYPINPNYPEIAGLKAYPVIQDAPGAVELAVLSVPSRMIPDMLRQCEEKSVRAINILTSGFSEISGEEGQRRQRFLIDFTKRTGIRIVGPNCFGNVNAVHHFAGMAGTYPAPKVGRLSLAFQSGGLAVTVVQNMIDRQSGFAHGLSTGNEADIEIADCLEFMAADEHTHVIGCFVEQFRNPQRFLRAAARCAAARKPIVMIKVGRSEAGQRAAQAHTGSLAGSDQIIDAVLKKAGVVRVKSIDEMFETMAIMHARKLPTGGAVGVLSDLAADLGVQFPPLAEPGRQAIRKLLYEYGTVDNPIDLTGQAVYDPPVQHVTFEAMGEDPNIHTILVFAGGNTRMDAQSPIGKVLLAAIQKYPDKLYVRSSSMYGSFRDKPYLAPDLIEPLSELDGVPFMQGVENALRAVAHLIWYADYQRKRVERPVAMGAAVVDERRQAAAQAIVRAARGQALSESAGKQVLALYGIPVTQERLATNAAEAAVHAAQIGFPVVMKIVSPQIVHKSEAGGVALNVQDEAEAGAAFERLMQSARRYKPDAELLGVSAQEMVCGGREVIVGMISDPSFGPGVLLGLGGIFVEILKDAVLRVPPLGTDDAREMIESLQGKAILKGARGQAPADMAALIDVLQKFGQLCLELSADVREIDINPLLLLDAGKGAKAVDCLIVPA
jgi:acetate---CoA ligase (ADP-forming)